MLKLCSFPALIKKELLQVLKNPKTRTITFVPVLMQLIMLGYAATLDLSDVPFAVLDHARTPESRALISKFSGNRIFRMQPPPDSEKDMARRMDNREIKLALVIPEDFSRKLAAKQSPQVQIITDGRNSFSAGIAAGYANDVITLYNHQNFPETADAFRIVIRGWYNPNYSAQYFMIPALLAIIVLLDLMLLVALSLAREREAGTMDQLLLTPYSPMELLAAKALSVVLIGLIQLALCMLIVLFWFRIPYVSHYGLLALLFFCFLMASVGIGLLVSVHCANLQQAMIWIFIFASPFAMLSGMATPIECMPQFLQDVMVINPMRWSVAALHRLFLEGATFQDILPTYLILAAIGIVSFSFACISFYRQRRG